MVEICEHDIDPQMLICLKCYLTAEEIAQGRDQQPTWYDVDYAYQEGKRLGIVIGEALYKKKRRLKLIEVGYYLALRRIGREVNMTEVAEPENGDEEETSTESEENGNDEESEEE